MSSKRDLFIYLNNTMYYVPDTVPGAGDIAVNKTKSVCTLTQETENKYMTLKLSGALVITVSGLQSK